MLVWRPDSRGRKCRQVSMVQSQSFKNADAASYDAVAAAFDRLSERYSAPFAERLIELADLRPGDRVLDLGCGSGVVVRRAAATGARAVGVDLSEGMLRTASRGPLKADWARMDAEALALRDRSVDAAVSLFAFLHFPAAAAALAECRRTMKAGAPLAIAFGSPAPWPWEALGRAPGAVWDRVQERRGLLLRAPAALEAFVERRFPAAQAQQAPAVANAQQGAAARLRRIVAEAGFEKIETGWLRKRFRLDSAEAFWELQSIFSSEVRKRLAELSEERYRGAAKRVHRLLRRDARTRGRACLRRRGRLDPGASAGMIQSAAFAIAAPTRAYCGLLHDSVH